MKILVAGDTHGSIRAFEYLMRMACQEDCDRIIQVGDFGYWPHMSNFHVKVNRLARHNDVIVFWLDGNHENFDALEAAVDFDADSPQQMLSNLWYLPRASTWEWDGCRFMALGGAYSVDKASRVEGLSWWRQELLTHAQVERALGRPRVDVLFTHDAPDKACPIVTDSYKGDYTSLGNRKAVSAVVESCRPKLVVHGHYHHAYVTQLDGTTVVGLDRDGTGEASITILDTDRWRDCAEGT